MVNELSESIATAVKEIKSAIVKAQARVSVNANAELLALYYGIGRYVSHKIKSEKWGTGVIDTISLQLQMEMWGLRGFSGKSIRKLRQFFKAWQSEAILPSVTAKLPTFSGSVTAAEFLSISEMPEKLRRALPPIDALRKQLEIAGESVP